VFLVDVLRSLSISAGALVAGVSDSAMTKAVCDVWRLVLTLSAMTTGIDRESSIEEAIQSLC